MLGFTVFVCIVPDDFVLSQAWSTAMLLLCTYMS